MFCEKFPNYLKIINILCVYLKNNKICQKLFFFYNRHKFYEYFSKPSSSFTFVDKTS